MGWNERARQKILSVLLVVLVSGWACSEDKIVQPRPAPSLESLVLEAMRAASIPALAAAIIDENGISWEAYLANDQAGGATPNGQTTFILASISKTVTAVAVMQLYEQGRIDLDRDISDYLGFSLRNPHFPDVPLTTRMLLTHRTGLAWPNGQDPNFYQTFPGESAPRLHPWMKNYLTPGSAEYRPAIWLQIRPGTTVQYSNIGGALLGYLVEAVSGQDFADYCIENIFEPLEMPNSGFDLHDVRSADLARLVNLNGTTALQYSVKFYPATTVRSSIREFSHFVMAIMAGGVYKGNRILREDTVREMLDLKIAASGLAFIWWAHGNNWMGHTGSFVGVSSSMDINRTNNVGVLIFSNIANRTSVWPGGEIYKLIHDVAERDF